MKTKASSLRNFTYAIISFIGVVYILKVGSFIFIPLMWAAFFSFALMPVTTWFENKRIPRLISILISLLLITVFTLLIIYLFITQLSSLLKDAPEMGDKIQAVIHQIERNIQESSGLQHVFKNLNWDVTTFINEKNLNNVLLFTTSTVTTFTLIPVFIFLFLYYQDFFREFIVRLSLHGNEKFFAWMQEAIKVVRKYLTGLLVVTIIVSILASIIFYFLGIKYYLLFGLFTALCNLIPYVGVILGSIITLLYVLLTTNQLWYPFVTLLLLWLLQVIENNFITPVVVGAKIKLNPLAVILAIITGGALWGVSGMILFIPVLGIIKIFLDKDVTLKPYSYVLGDDILVHETKENIFSYLKSRFRKHSVEKNRL